MHIPALLESALAVAAAVKYPLIALGAFVEGPTVMIAAGFVIRQRELLFYPTVSALIIGDLLADSMWYAIGRYTVEPIIIRKGKVFGITLEKFEFLKSIFNSHPGKILFISKITLGFGIAKGTLMASGAATIPYGIFLFWNTLGEIILVGTLILLGYFFGDLYSRISHDYRHWFAIGVVVVVILTLMIITAVMQKRFAHYQAGKTKNPA